MTRNRTPLFVVSMLALQALPLLPTPLAAQGSRVTTYTPERIAWKGLSYRASKLGVKVDSQVSIGMVPSSSVEFIENKKGGARVKASGEKTCRMTIVTNVKSKEETLNFWLDPKNASALQRQSLAMAKKRNTFRSYLFTEGGVYAIGQESKDGSGDPASWPVAGDGFYEHNAGRDASLVMSEASGLFYILSAADFTRVGDTLRFYHFDRDGTVEVTLKVEELLPYKVDYTEVSPSGQRQVKATKEVARLTISGKPAPGSGGADFSFMGMRGNVELFVDPELRVPVGVRGKVPVAGRTTVNVNRIELK